MMQTETMVVAKKCTTSSRLRGMGRGRSRAHNAAQAAGGAGEGAGTGCCGGWMQHGLRVTQLRCRGSGAAGGACQQLPPRPTCR